MRKNRYRKEAFQGRYGCRVYEAKPISRKAKIRLNLFPAVLYGCVEQGQKIYGDVIDRKKTWTRRMSKEMTELSSWDMLKEHLTKECQKKVIGSKYGKRRKGKIKQTWLEKVKTYLKRVCVVEGKQ